MSTAHRRSTLVGRTARRARFSRITPLLAALAALLASASPARAREIFFDYGDHARAEEALVFSDIRPSRIVLSELGCPSRPVWLEFEAARGDSLLVQLGVPAIAALRRERPSLALLGPGLPRAAAALPFEAPAGRGARIFTTASVGAPTVVRDPLTEARSWLLLERRIEVPESGRYHLVAWSPEERRVRLWIAVGEEPSDDTSNVDDPAERAAAFHQDWTAPDLGAPCAAARLPARARPPAPAGGASTASCAHAAAPARGALPALAAALALAAARRARRRGPSRR
ncbi:hypothetical protein WME76_00345 [Sorangium sp. So ce119]|uniref:hypothetical protein n=1 Tax=Sorangium sp. So ce119 TaxID=3133279 RepID=UPI003F60B214